MAHIDVLSPIQGLAPHLELPVRRAPRLPSRIGLRPKAPTATWVHAFHRQVLLWPPRAISSCASNRDILRPAASRRGLPPCESIHNQNSGPAFFCVRRRLRRRGFTMRLRKPYRTETRQSAAESLPVLRRANDDGVRRPEVAVCIRASRCRCGSFHP